MEIRLTEKQRRFVEAYMGQACGNATEAARLAGYKGNSDTLRTVAAENLAKPNVRKSIEQRHKTDPLVMGRKELQAMWTDVANDETVLMTHRLKASELLARSQALFTERQIVEEPHPTADEQRQAMRPLLNDPEALDDLKKIMEKLDSDFQSGPN